MASCHLNFTRTQVSSGQGGPPAQLPDRCVDGKTALSPQRPRPQPHAGAGGPFQRNAFLFFQKKSNFNIHSGTDVERCFAPSLLTRRLSAALAPDRGTGASSPLRGAPSWEPHLACLLFAGWFYCLPPFGARRSAGHGAGARRIPVKRMETPHVPARASERLCAADAGRGRPRGVRGPRVGSRASRRWGLHGRRMHSFLRSDDAAFIPQRRSPSLPPTQLPCFSRSNSITWRPPTCCSLGPGTARSWCSRKTRRSCWPKKASPCPPSFPSPRWVGGALGPEGLLPAAARPWISPLGLPR